MTNYPMLDLLDPTRTTTDEIDALLGRLRDRGITGYPLTAFALWAEHRPEVLKRYALSVDAQMPTPESARLCNLAVLHEYSVARFAPGIAWELDTARRLGYSKAEVLEVLALAYLNGGPSTQAAVHEAAAEPLRRWPEPPADRPGFPSGWHADPEAFRSGLDLATGASMSARELAGLRGWHLRATGEVPGSVELLAKLDPTLLKAYRLRWENCIQVLPKQVMPFVLLHHNVVHGRVEGARQAARLARSWGVARAHAVLAMTLGLTFGGGLETLDCARQACAAVLDGWD